MKKKFGQNFLINQTIIDKILNSANLNNNSFVYEVGPGDGALTKEIIKANPKQYLAVEIDESLKPKLEKEFFKKNHKLIFANALKLNERILFEKNAVIIANLPYNISLQLLLKWVHQHALNPWFNMMVLMFQKEVGERILSDENSKKFGRITLIVSAFFKISKVTNVSKNDFFPVPSVESVVLKFESLKKPYLDLDNIPKLEFLSRDLFSNRRKKLKKKIEKLYSSSVIKKHNLEVYFDLRPENLKKEIFYSLAKLL